MLLEIVAAVDSELGIGRLGGLPWHIPEDLQHFRKITSGNTILMGRKTWDSLPNRPLKDRINCVLSSTYPGSGPLWFKSLDTAMDYFDNTGVGKVFVIGGSNLFRDTICLPCMSVLHITRVSGTHNSDSFFPEFEHLFERHSVRNSMTGDPGYSFETWLKISGT